MQKNLLTWIGLGLLGLVFIFSVFHFFQGPRYGVIDVDKVLSQSEKGKAFQQSLSKKLNDMNRELSIELSTIPDAAKKEAKRYEYKQRFDQWQQEQLDVFGKEFDKTLSELAKQNGLDGVFRKDALRYSKYDLTDKLIDKLK